MRGGSCGTGRGSPRYPEGGGHAGRGQARFCSNSLRCQSTPSSHQHCHSTETLNSLTCHSVMCGHHYYQSEVVLKLSPSLGQSQVEARHNFHPSTHNIHCFTCKLTNPQKHPTQGSREVLSATMHTSTCPTPAHLYLHPALRHLQRHINEQCEQCGACSHATLLQWGGVAPRDLFHGAG